MTEFQEKIYQVVKKIPAGKTMTYKKVAETAGFPRSWRAVGNALRKNKNPVIPCHRVVMSSGKIGGYNQGKRKKFALLKAEGAAVVRQSNFFSGINKGKQ